MCGGLTHLQYHENWTNMFGIHLGTLGLFVDTDLRRHYLSKLTSICQNWHLFVKTDICLSKLTTDVYLSMLIALRYLWQIPNMFFSIFDVFVDIDVSEQGSWRESSLEHIIKNLQSTLDPKLNPTPNSKPSTGLRCKDNRAGDAIRHIKRKLNRTAHSLSIH